MFSWLKGNSNSKDKGEEKTNPDKKIQIATSAVLMEIAGADNEFTDDEKGHIVGLLKERFSLTDPEIEELMAQARNKIDNSIDFWSIANAAGQGISEEDKLKVMETAWKIIYSDGELSGHEDVFIHKLYYLLGLTHGQMIDVKMRVLDQIKGKG